MAQSASETRIDMHDDHDLRGRWSTGFRSFVSLTSREYRMVAVVLLLSIFAGQAVLSMRQKSVTVDELMYIAAGYYNLKTGRFDLNNTNPPLMKMISALPLLGMDLRLPPMDSDPKDWNEIKQWQYARAFIYDNSVEAESIVFLSRLPVVATGLVLGIFVYLWSSKLYGLKAGLLALLLFSFSPNLLAHTRLATQDLGLATFVLITAYFFWRLLLNPSLGRLLITSLSFSAAVLTKTSALFLAPTVLVFSGFVVLLWPGLGIWQKLPFLNRISAERVRTRQTVSLITTYVLVGVVFLVGLNAGFHFEGSFEPLSNHIEPEKVTQKLHLESDVAASLVTGLMTLPSVIPEPLIQMLKFQSGRVSSGYSIYLAGSLSSEGWWYLMPLAFLIKTPIALLCLLLLACYQLVRWEKITSAELLILSIVTMFFALFMYLKGVGIGLRYILPTIPLLMIFASRVLRDDVAQNRTKQAIVALLLAWYVISGVRIYPHYLAHFNEFVGGPSNGYRYLADSFLDWGQDLRGLKHYLDERGIKRVRLAYFGSADARYYDIDYEYLPSIGLAPNEPGGHWWYEMGPEDLPPLDLSRGPIAVSATLLAGVFFPGYYAPLRDMEPVAQIGHSILIYEPTAPESSRNLSDDLTKSGAGDGPLEELR